ncbi:MAG TPA: hypothetical protein GX711_01190, partial [Clostridia bacterium]|nr:hypothetical protein [Clostridia bacterium]
VLRGDQISVVSIPFDAQPEEIPEEIEKEPAKDKAQWYRLAAVATGIAILLLVFFLLFRRRKVPQVDDIPTMETPISIDHIVPELTVEERIHKERQRKITDIAREKPEEAVQLLRTWLLDE